MTEEAIDSLVRAHIQWRVRQGATKVQSPYNPALRRSAQRLLIWCEKNGIEDAKLYLDTMYEHVYSKHGKHAHLAFIRSQKMVAHWKAWLEGRALREQSDQRLNASEAPTVVKKLRPHQEKFKSSYIGREALCAEYQQYTGGFNNESRYCKVCPAQQLCIKRGRAS